MEIGTKIRKVREIKDVSQEYVAEQLGMSVTGYGKIERNEVGVSYEKLVKISDILQLPVEAIIGFDDKIAFNNFNNTKVEWQVGHYMMPVEMKKLYEDKIRLLEDKIEYLQKQLDMKTEQRPVDKLTEGYERLASKKGTIDNKEAFEKVLSKSTKLKNSRGK